MLPPDKAFRREANAQYVRTSSTGSSTQNLSILQKILRFFEKDDFLLYLTALFGICMPAVMYFFYKTVHFKYYAYQNEKKEIKRREMIAKQNKRSITIFYCGAGTSTKQLAYNLAEELDRFEPLVSNLSSGNIYNRIKNHSKTVLLFIIETKQNGEFPDIVKAFVDWLDEIRYEYRQKTFFRGSSFAIFGLGPLIENTEIVNNKAAESLHAQIKSMQGNPIYEAPTAADSSNKTDIEQKLKNFSSEMAQMLKQFQYGAFDEAIKGLSFSDENETSSTIESLSSDESTNS